jgi:hypothetical protein
VIKSAEAHVKSGQGVIRNAEELYMFCTQELTIGDRTSLDCEHKKRAFFYEKTIQRKTTPKQLTTLEGTRKLHNVRTVRAGVVEARNLSCYCDPCIRRQPGCKHSNYVGQWTTRTLLCNRLKSNAQKTKANDSSVPPKKTTARHTQKTKADGSTVPPRETTTRNSQKTKSNDSSVPPREITPRQIRKRKSDDSSVPLREIAPRNSRKRKTDDISVPVKEITTRNMRKRKSDGSSVPLKEITTRNMQKTKSDDISVPVKETTTRNIQNVNTVPRNESNGKRHIPDRDKFFTDLQRKCSSSTFAELSEICHDINNDMEEYPIQCTPEQLSILSLGASVDKHSLQLMPPDYGGLVPRFPINVCPDGNCLPRCGSLCTFGTENRHVEIRMRIIHELVLHEDMYLDHSFLANGMPEQQCRKDTPGIYTQYSEQYKFGAKITTDLRRAVYRAGIMSITKVASYMGVWQMHALASVLHCPVQSVYPMYAGAPYRRDLHRKIVPERSTTTRSVYIMWTHTLGAEIEEGVWRPNHFVVLLPVDIDQDDGLELEEVSEELSGVEVEEMSWLTDEVQDVSLIMGELFNTSGEEVAIDIELNTSIDGMTVPVDHKTEVENAVDDKTTCSRDSIAETGTNETGSAATGTKDTDTEAIAGTNATGTKDTGPEENRYGHAETK